MAGIAPDLDQMGTTRDAHGIKTRVDGACDRIAPTWPLDRFIAVNPFWSMTHQPLPEVASQLRAHSGAQLLMPRSWFQQAWARGELRNAHLSAAIAAAGTATTPRGWAPRPPNGAHRACKATWRAMSSPWTRAATSPKACCAG